MGALAVIALLAGGPLGMCLALAYGVVAVMKIAKVDAQYAAKGQTPPGYQLIEKWLDQRKARGQAPADAKPAKYGMWRYVWQRWQAAWELMAQAHRLEHEKRLKDRADAAAKGEPAPKSPSIRERSKAGWKWVIDKIVNPVGEDKEQDSQPEPADAVVAQPATATVEGPRIACEDCGQTLTDKNGTWEHPSSAGCLNKPATGEQIDIPLNDPNTTTKPTSTTDEGESMTATVQPTTQMSGEVTGIRSAIAYLNAMAEAHASHASNEGFLGSAARMEMGDGDVAKIRAAMEASRNAAAMWAAAAESVDTNNRAVREAYSVAPDAANKQAQINE